MPMVTICTWLKLSCFQQQRLLTDFCLIGSLAFSPDVQNTVPNDLLVLYWGHKVLLSASFLRQKPKNRWQIPIQKPLVYALYHDDLAFRGWKTIFCTNIRTLLNPKLKGPALTANLSSACFSFVPVFCRIGNVPKVRGVFHWGDSSMVPDVIGRLIRIVERRIQTADTTVTF